MDRRLDALLLRLDLLLWDESLDREEDREDLEDLEEAELELLLLLSLLSLRYRLLLLYVLEVRATGDRDRVRRLCSAAAGRGELLRARMRSATGRRAELLS
jgi:hypothetical protein